MQQFTCAIRRAPHTFFMLSAFEGNHPNPFNGTTEIRFALPEASAVRLVIYNMLGQEVARLVDREIAAGYHTVTWEASDMPPGLYVSRFTAGDFTESARMVVAR